jgi:ferredoxin/flavodoxin---NADP+ reductase
MPALLPAQIEELRQKRYNGEVMSVQKVNSDLMVLRIKPDFPKPSAIPGQYCSLGLGNWEPRYPGTQLENLKPEDESKLIRRAYSLSCSMIDKQGSLLEVSGLPFLEFYIVLVREGSDPAKAPALTPRLFMLQEGDRLNVGEKVTGHYTLEHVKPTDNVIFLSTGTGEAPHNYMTWQLLKNGHQGKILSACCVRLQKDLGYLETHQKLMQQYRNYGYMPLTTREPALGGRKVYIQDLISSGEMERILNEPLDPQKTHVFLCGNPKMIGVPEKDAGGNRVYQRDIGVIELLERRGFAADNATTKFKGNIHFEEYW